MHSGQVAATGFYNRRSITVDASQVCISDGTGTDMSQRLKPVSASPPLVAQLAAWLPSRRVTAFAPAAFQAAVTLRLVCSGSLAKCRRDKLHSNAPRWLMRVTRRIT
jgi:hypothetical protein